MYIHRTMPIRGQWPSISQGKRPSKKKKKNTVGIIILDFLRILLLCKSLNLGYFIMTTLTNKYASMFIGFIILSNDKGVLAAYSHGNDSVVFFFFKALTD